MRARPNRREAEMILELKPEQQRVLVRAAESGMSPEEVLDQAFAVIHEQFGNEEWLAADKDAVAAQIEEGFAQAERGELVDGDQAVLVLRERRSKRRLA
jgi:predicted transcriptional regulator